MACLPSRPSPRQYAQWHLVAQASGCVMLGSLNQRKAHTPNPVRLACSSTYIQTVSVLLLEMFSISSVVLTRTNLLTTTATVKLRHKDKNPAFSPPIGSLLLRIKNAVQKTPTIIPLNTPAIVTRF